MGFNFLINTYFFYDFSFFYHTRCEAMSENTDDIPGFDTLVNAITGESPASSIPQTLASTFGGGSSRPPTSSAAGTGSSLLSTFENLIFGKRRSSVPSAGSFSRPFGPQHHRPVQHHQRFRQANIRRPIRRPSSNSPFISRREDEAFRPSRPISRTKRQTRLQGNIIRLELELCNFCIIMNRYVPLLYS